MARTHAAATKANTVTGEDGRSVTRVFHPSLDTWHDVATEDVATWHEAGWTAEPGEHNNVDNYRPLVDHAVKDDGTVEPVDSTPTS